MVRAEDEFENIHLGLWRGSNERFRSQAVVKLTAMQIISGDTSGKIRGAGAHQFKTTLHGGQACIFLAECDNLDAPIISRPDAAHNGSTLTRSAGHAHLFDLRRQAVLSVDFPQ